MLLDEGNRFYQKKEYGKALGYFEKVLQIDTNNVQAYIGKGNCLRQQEQYNPAIEVYQQALRLDPHRESAQRGKSLTLGRLGRPS